MGAERGTTQEAETMAMGAQIQEGRIEPVARRQSLQWSMVMKGRWTAPATLFLFEYG